MIRARSSFLPNLTFLLDNIEVDQCFEVERNLQRHKFDEQAYFLEILIYFLGLLDCFEIGIVEGSNVCLISKAHMNSLKDIMDKSRRVSDIWAQ